MTDRQLLAAIEQIVERAIARASRSGPVSSPEIGDLPQEDR